MEDFWTFDRYRREEKRLPFVARDTEAVQAYFEDWKRTSDVTRVPVLLSWCRVYLYRFAIIHIATHPAYTEERFARFLNSAYRHVEQSIEGWSNTAHFPEWVNAVGSKMYGIIVEDAPRGHEETFGVDLPEGPERLQFIAEALPALPEPLRTLIRNRFLLHQSYEQIFQGQPDAMPEFIQQLRDNMEQLKNRLRPPSLPPTDAPKPEP